MTTPASADEEVRAALSKGEWRMWNVETDTKTLVLVDSCGHVQRIEQEQVLRMLTEEPRHVGGWTDFGGVGRDDRSALDAMKGGDPI